MGRISALTELTSLASNDYIIVLDSSANIAKKISVANAFGIPDFGWTASGESWTFSSFSSTTRIGVVTVPSDATTKYYKGMRVKLTQSTGGTKYAIIHKVTSTTLTLFFQVGTTLNNEAITTPFYSIAYAPAGFNADKTQWLVSVSSTTTFSQTNPTNGTWYQRGPSLTIGIGLYDVRFKRHLTVTSASAGSGAESRLGTSSTSGAVDQSHHNLFDISSTNSQSGYESIFAYEVASETTLYPQVMRNTGTNAGIVGYEVKPYSVLIEAYSAYI